MGLAGTETGAAEPSPPLLPASPSALLDVPSVRGLVLGEELVGRNFIWNERARTAARHFFRHSKDYVWREYATPDQRRFYVNRVTGESRWLAPERYLPHRPGDKAEPLKAPPSREPEPPAPRTGGPVGLPFRHQTFYENKPVTETEEFL